MRICVKVAHKTHDLKEIVRINHSHITPSLGVILWGYSISGSTLTLQVNRKSSSLFVSIFYNIILFEDYKAEKLIKFYRI